MQDREVFKKEAQILIKHLSGINFPKHVMNRTWTIIKETELSLMPIGQCNGSVTLVIHPKSSRKNLEYQQKWYQLLHHHQYSNIFAAISSEAQLPISEEKDILTSNMRSPRIQLRGTE